MRIRNISVRVDIKLTLDGKFHALSLCPGESFDGSVVLHYPMPFRILEWTNVCKEEIVEAFPVILQHILLSLLRAYHFF